MKTNATDELIETTFKIFRLMKDNMCYVSSIKQLTLLQLQALIFINNNSSVPMKKIAEYFCIELPSATSLLNKLTDMNLVERQSDPNDRRLVRIKLTNEGQTLLKNAMLERAKKMERLLSFLSEEDKATMLRIVTTLTEKMEVGNEV